MEESQPVHSKRNAVTYVEDDKHDRYCPFVFVMKEMERSYNEPGLHRLVALNENDAHIEDSTINRDVVSMLPFN